MHIELSDDEALALREMLQEKVREMDTEINRADSLRFKTELRAIERKLVHVLSSVTAAMDAGRPADWEERDNVSDE
jgi:hypothetical protein